jgi:hypothetical protein
VDQRGILRGLTVEGRERIESEETEERKKETLVRLPLLAENKFVFWCISSVLDT